MLEFTNILTVLNNYGKSTVDSMRSILISAGKDATGNLVNNISFIITYNQEDISIEFSMPEYGVFVDKGRRPGKQPPISAILPWLKIKGIPESAAFPIARNIGRFGIQPTPFFETSIEKNKESLIRDLETAIAQDIESYIVNKLKNANTA